MTIQFPVYTFHFLYSSCGCSSKGLPASEELPVSVSTTLKVTLQPTWPKKPKMALISEYLAADSSSDASADALAIINIRRFRPKQEENQGRVTEWRSFGRLPNFILISKFGK